MAYDLIIGSNATANDRAEFIAAVNTAGGAAVCVGGCSESGNVLVQAVDITPACLSKLMLFVRGMRSVKIGSAAKIIKPLANRGKRKRAA